MSRLSNRFNWGNDLPDENPTLHRQLNDTYTNIVNSVNVKSNKNVTPDTDPPADDPINANFDEGDVWVRCDTNAAWIMTSRTSANAVNWKSI